MDVRSQKNMDVRSQIGQADQLKTMMIGWPTLQRRGKPCPIRKKVGKKEKMGCPISKNQGCPISDGKETSEKYTCKIVICNFKKLL